MFEQAVIEVIQSVIKISLVMFIIFSILILICINILVIFYNFYKHWHFDEKYPGPVL